MEKVAQVIIFLSGLGSLFLYIASIINEARENRKMEVEENKVNIKDKNKHKSIIRIALLAAGLFSFAILLHKLLLHIPRSDLTGDFGFFALFLMVLEFFYKFGLIDLGSNLGMILWFFSFLPYLIFMTLWLMMFFLKKIIMRN